MNNDPENFRIVKDYNGIFAPKPLLDFTKKYLDVIDLVKHGAKDFSFAFVPEGVFYQTFVKTFDRYSNANVDKYCKFMTRTLGNLYVKMLAELAKRPCSYDDIYTSVLAPKGIAYGNDVGTWRSLFETGLSQLDHKGAKGRKFYSLTALGKAVLDTAEKNHVAYKVLRHFMKFKDDFEVYSLQVNFNPETMNDMDPQSFVDMLDAVLNESSDLHAVGSYAYWCNKIIDCLKKNINFFELFNCPEVNAYLEKNASCPTVQRFNKIWDKICKKHAKAAA